ncbi:MAG: hypothetical protein WD042_19510 [Phycisphaeraceae bacterium]
MSCTSDALVEEAGLYGIAGADAPCSIKGCFRVLDEDGKPASFT